MRILLIEDEKALVEVIKDRLKRRYTIDAAYTGRTGVHLASVCQYDLILLDLGLEDIPGSEVCRLIRSQKNLSPILIITGAHKVSDKISHLDAGADDYLVKPFSFDELDARIRALLRRPPRLMSETLKLNDLTVDTANRIVTRGGRVIRLRRKEYDILEYMMRNQGKVLRRDMILENVWDDDSMSYTNVVDVHIKYLRDRIDKQFDCQLIKTVHGLGYKIEHTEGGD